MYLKTSGLARKDRFAVAVCADMDSWDAGISFRQTKFVKRKFSESLEVIFSTETRQINWSFEGNVQRTVGKNSSGE